MSLLLLWLGCGSAATAAEPEAHFTLQPRVVVDILHDRRGEDVAESWTWMRATATGPARTGRWFLEVQADYAVLMGIDAHTDVEAAANLWVGESGWAGELGPVYVRAGTLVDRWGTLDLLPVTDILNGRDLRAGPLTPLEHARVPAPMVRVEAGDDRLRAGVVLLPVGARSRVPLWGTDYALLRQGMVEGLVSDAATWSDDPLFAGALEESLGTVADNLRALDAQSRRGLEGALGESGAPRPLYEAAELGAELQSRVGPVDLALTGAWMRSRVPAPRLSPALSEVLQTQTLPALTDREAVLATLESGTVRSDRPRTWTVGLSSQALLGAMGVRAESSYTRAVVVPTPYLDYTLSPQWMVGAGLDRATSTRLTVVAEARWRHLVDAPEQALMVGTPDHVEVAGGLRSSLARDRLTVEAGALVDLAFSEVAAQPAVRLRASDTLDVGVGAVLLMSPTPAAETWSDALAYTGGLVGYSSDTDAIWLDLRWMR